MRRWNNRTTTLLAFTAIALLVSFSALAEKAGEDPELESALRVVDELKSPGLEAEISGIYPHPDDPNLYFALANLKPPYRHGQEPKLAEEYRGSLLTVNRDGEVQNAIPLARDDFGGLEYVGGHFFVALTQGAEILKVEATSGEIVDRIALPSPAGGLGYDADRGVLIAQLYVGHPHLAVVDPDSGQILENLWSDESAMGLAKVDGDWLCTWASGWDPGSFSELRVLDQATGKVRARVNLDAVHSSLAPVSADGQSGFMSLVTVDSASGETVIRKYAYQGESKWARM